MADLAAEWRGLSAEEKAAFRRPAALPLPAQVDAPSVTNARGQEVWPHSGDELYPIRSVVLGDLAQRVGRLSQQWANRIGRATVKASCDFDAQVKHVCGAT